MPNREKTVLIVEDALDIQALLASFLETEGFDIQRAKNGREALDSLATSKLPGVILLDLRMPEMDGYEFREAQLKDARIAKIPVVVMTADGNIDEQAQQIGAKAYLRKPFSDLDSLLNTVASFFKS